MKTTDLVPFLVAAIKAHRNVLLVGPPSTAKTACCWQAAKLAKVQAHILHPINGDPTDGKGLPHFYNDDAGKLRATFVPFWELESFYDDINAGIPTIMCLDDIGQATPSVQNSYTPMMDRVRGIASVIATTNRRIDRSGVQGLLDNVQSRFDAIIEVELDLDGFLDHLQDNIETYHVTEQACLDVVGFLSLRPTLLHKILRDAETAKDDDAPRHSAQARDIENFPCYRTWIATAQWVSLSLPASQEAEAIAGAIGKGEASEFLAFKKIHRDLPSVDSILANVAKAEVPTDPSVRWAVVTALAAKAAEANFGAVIAYAHKLQAAHYGQFAVLLIHASTRRKKALQNTAAFIALCQTPLGELIRGKYA